jgi:hypothetical protein
MRNKCQFLARNAAGFVISAILCLAFLLTCGQNGEESVAVSMHQIMPDEILGWELQDSVRSYDRETIFEYINGAGEVYLSYDFRQVTVFEYARDNAPRITVELFDMATDEDAYGIFSHGRADEQTSYFVCVQAEGQAQESYRTVLELARIVSGQLPMTGNRPQLVSRLPEEGLIPHSVRFFHLHSSLNYHYFLTIENIMRLDRNTRAVLAEYATGPTYLLCVQYPTPEQAEQGYEGVLKGYAPEAEATGAAEVDQDMWLAAELGGEYVLVAFDAPSEDDARRLITTMAERL